MFTRLATIDWLVQRIPASISTQRHTRRETKGSRKKPTTVRPHVMPACITSSSDLQQRLRCAHLTDRSTQKAGRWYSTWSWRQPDRLSDVAKLLSRRWGNGFISWDSSKPSPKSVIWRHIQIHQIFLAKLPRANTNPNLIVWRLKESISKKSRSTSRVRPEKRIFSLI